MEAVETKPWGFVGESPIFVLMATRLEGSALDYVTMAPFRLWTPATKPIGYTQRLPVEFVTNAERRRLNLTKNYII